VKLSSASGSCSSQESVLELHYDSPSICSMNPAHQEKTRDLPTLRDRIVWITGAGSGIGRAMALGFAAVGAKVAVTGRRFEALAETASQIGETALVVPADVSDADQVTKAYETVSQTWGAVDILVNNTGRNSSKRHWRQLTVAEMSSMLDVNLKTAFLCSMVVLPAMRSRKCGTLIHVGSMSATMVFPTAGASYAAAKSGLRQMSAHINAEEGIHGIRSICIHPGEVATEILTSRPNPPTQAEQGLMLQADDIATTAVFAAGLPARVTVSEITIVPTDNQAWRSYAQAIANG
jgi:NADP-dependent 3-hydroxy acid dehydrogenase YdfG